MSDKVIFASDHDFKILELKHDGRIGIENISSCYKFTCTLWA